MTQEVYEVVIVGGGVAGLSCAHFLKKTGWSNFIVLESTNYMGGRMSGDVHKDFTYSRGAEYIGPPERFFKTLVDDLKLEVLRIPYPMDAMYREGKVLCGKPGIYKWLIEKTSVDTYKKFVKLLFAVHEEYDEIPHLDYTASLMKELDNLTAYEWLVKNGIPEPFLEKYEVSTRGLFGASTKEISALSFIDEAVFDFMDEDLEVSMASDLDSDIHKKPNGLSFKRGLPELVFALHKELKEHIRMKSRVTSVKKISGDETQKGHECLYEVVYEDSNSGMKKCEVTKIKCKKVVFAVPAPVVLSVTSTSDDEDGDARGSSVGVLPPRTRSLLGTISYSCCLKIALFSKKPLIKMDAFDICFPNSFFFTDIYDCTWMERSSMNQKNEEGEDKKDAVHIISVYIVPQRSTDREIMQMKQSELVARVQKDLKKAKMDFDMGDVTGVDVVKFEYAYPVMTRGAYKRLLELNKANEGNVLLAGDYMIYPTLEAAITSGGMVARKLGGKE